MTKRLTLPLFVALMSVTLAACGFKLRGLYDVPEALRQVQLVTASSPSQIEPELRSALEVNQIRLTESGRYRLEILSEQHTRRTATLTAKESTPACKKVSE